MLSTDVKIFDSTSPVAERMRSYGALTQKLTILVLGTGERRALDLSENVHVLFPGGNTKSDAFKNALWEGMREGRELETNLVTTQDPFFVGFVGWRIAHALKAPLQVQIHTDFLNTFYAFSSVRRFGEVCLSLFILSQASCIRVVSKRIARSLSWLGKKPVFILPIRVESHDSSHERPQEYGTHPIVLMVSRMESEKRINLAIQALARISDAHLYIIGDGSSRTTLEELAQNLSLSERVHFLGWKKDTHAYYQHADVFLHLSRFEGYGLSLIEAGLASLPIVTTDVGVVGEVYNRGDDVLVVSKKVSHIAETLTAVLQSQELRTQLTNNAHMKAVGQLQTKSEYYNAYKASFEQCAK